MKCQKCTKAATMHITELLEEDKFREDLWFRLNVVPIFIPPLRERAGDVEHLARFYLHKYAGRYHLATRLTESGLKELESYTWPGNVRQLQHLMERLTILAPNSRIDSDAVRIAIESAEPRDSSSESLADAEAEQIRRVMAATNGNKSRAARLIERVFGGRRGRANPTCHGGDERQQEPGRADSGD